MKWEKPILVDLAVDLRASGHCFSGSGNNDQTICLFVGGQDDNMCYSGGVAIGYGCQPGTTPTHF